MKALLLALVVAAGPGAVLKPKGGPPPASFGGREALRPEEVDREGAADHKRDEQVAALKKIIPHAEDGSAQKAEMLFQLSELYWEKSRYLYRREMLTFFTAQKTSADPREDHRESELYRSETMRLYDAVLREYPAYDRKDEVLFNLAYNLYETGQREQAVQRYEELLRDYATSRFAPDTYIQLGNHAFEVANSIERARGYYERAWQSTNPKIRSYALYKLAWCDFNAGDKERALARLKQTIEFSEKQGKDRAFTDLKTEALADTVRVYVELDRLDDALAYLPAHTTKKRLVSLLAKLADGLLAAGRHESAIRGYRWLLTDAPLAEAAPEYQQAIIKSYEGLRARDHVRVEVRKLAELYRPGSDWWAANAAKAEVLQAGFNLAEEALRTSVTEYHLEAQKTKQVDTYRLARDIYRVYLDAFASSPDERYVSDHAFNLKFYYAEILWALEEWEAAARQYDEVTSFKVPERPEAKEVANERYRQTASYDAILAYEKLVKIERGRLAPSEEREGRRVEEARNKGSVERTQKLERRSALQLEEQPLSRFEAALVGACDRYNQKYPTNPDEIDVAYQAALVLYGRNHFVEAAHRFGEIILKHPDERRSQEAADLSMAVLEEKEEWAELNALARALKANTRLARPGTEFTRRVNAIVEGSQYKLADEVTYRKKKDTTGALAQFLAFVDEFPHSENADRALTYAMSIASEAGQLDTAAAIGERLLKAYPQTIFDLRVKYDLAKLYEERADFGRAAAMYGDFVATYDLATSAVPHGAKAPKDEKQRKEREALVERCTDKADNWVQNALFNAGLWREATGALDEAIAIKQSYVKRFKDAPDAPLVAAAAGALLERQGKLAEAIKVNDAVLATFGKDPRLGDGRVLELRYRQLKLEEQRKSLPDVDRAARELIAAWPKLKEVDRQSPQGLLALAHARFVVLEPAFRAYQELKFKRFATFKADRAAKEKKLAELVTAYTEVIQQGDPDSGIAALTRIGELYGDFAANIGELPDPPGLDDDQAALFRSELESRYVFPVEQKAVEALEKALAKASELSVYGEWVLLAQERLNRFRPGTYGKPHELEVRAQEPFVSAGHERVELAPAVSTAGQPPRSSSVAGGVP